MLVKIDAAVAFLRLSDRRLHRDDTTPPDEAAKTNINMQIGGWNIRPGREQNLQRRDYSVVRRAAAATANACCVRQSRLVAIHCQL